MNPESSSIRTKMRNLVLSFIGLTVMVSLLVMIIIGVYQGLYLKMLHNVTTASEFNQDFKKNIDAKMYYYVIESQYSEGLPVAEVRAAQNLARELCASTKDEESLLAITSVLDLCENLEQKIYEIEDTGSYDLRTEQLENNIYILTSLIQEYMYNYLYSEAVQLNTLQMAYSRQTMTELAVIILLVTGAGAVLIRNTVRLSQSITRPIERICGRVEEIGGGDLSPREPVASDEHEIEILSEGLETMVSQMNDLMRDTTQKQDKLRRAELALLQAQINPHFLYNTLDTIVWLIEAHRNQDAVEMISSLSVFFRSSLSNGADVIPLGTEIQQVYSYLQIQQARYKDILSYTINIPNEIRDAMLPKLTLQPLVENALYHGIKLKRGMGCICIQGLPEGEDIVLSVQDDGVGISPERLAQLREALRTGNRIGFGLVTVHERIQLLFGSRYGLSIDSQAGQGTQIRVRIPYRKEAGRQ